MGSLTNAVRWQYGLSARSEGKTGAKKKKKNPRSAAGDEGSTGYLDAYLWCHLYVALSRCYARYTLLLHATYIKGSLFAPSDGRTPGPPSRLVVPCGENGGAVMSRRE
jgi:hypothetical protein